MKKWTITCENSKEMVNGLVTITVTGDICYKLDDGKSVKLNQYSVIALPEKIVEMKVEEVSKANYVVGE